MFDIGANLTHQSFADDFDHVLANAQALGITDISITSSTLEDSYQAQAIISTTDSTIDMSTTVGFHPHYADQYHPSFYQEMYRQCQQPLVQAVGETGLDFFRNISSEKDQKDSFEAHMELAIDTGLPLFLHQRDAHKAFTEMLTSHREKLHQVVVHCFTGDKDMLYQYLDLDCHIGITGWICNPHRGQHLWPLVTDIPCDKLMVETDSPYLLPPQHKQQFGRRNEPQCLPAIIDTIAEHRSESSEQIAQLTTNNARLFFTPDKQS